MLILETPGLLNWLMVNLGDYVGFAIVPWGHNSLKRKPRDGQCMSHISVSCIYCVVFAN